MAEIFVVGQCSDGQMVEAEELKYLVEDNVPWAKINLIYKRESEWGEYLKKICSVYGFFQKDHLPMAAFTREGVWIGDLQDLNKYVSQRFPVKLQAKSLLTESQDKENLAQSNSAQNDVHTKDNAHKLPSEEVQQRVQTNLLIKENADKSEASEVSELENQLIKKQQLFQAKTQFQEIIHQNGKMLKVKWSSKVINRCFKAGSGLEMDVDSLSLGVQKIFQDIKSPDLSTNKKDQKVKNKFFNKKTTIENKKKQVGKSPIGTRGSFRHSQFQGDSKGRKGDRSKINHRNSFDESMFEGQRFLQNWYSGLLSTGIVSFAW